VKKGDTAAALAEKGQIEIKVCKTVGG